MADNDYLNPLSTKLDADQTIRRAYDEGKNRHRVDAEVTATIGTVDVIIDAAGGDNIAIADQSGTNYLHINNDGSINVNVDNVTLDQSTSSVAIGDGTNLIHINPDGSINAVIQDSALTTRNLFNEVDNVISGITTEVISYTAAANTKLLSCDFGGTNVAAFSLYIGGNLAAKKYTFFQSLNERFNFMDGLPINSGDVITVEVIHNRPDPGSFNVNMLIKN